MSADEKYLPPPTNEDGFPARLRQVVSSYGSTNALATHIERSEGAIRKWLRGQSEPGVSDLRAICLATNTSVEWLVMGRGERKPRDRIDDPAGGGGSGPLSKVNPGLMEDVIETVGLDTKLEGIALTPGKCSALLSLVYNASCATRHIDQDSVRAALVLARG
ncbi:MAG TPA: helix-turn-helix transcriptional regulator [Steroidobacteraceae bacterium]|nr:helix-turn-helix transcriptional regulator [Steroidobacteraceae bacterium]